METVMPLHLRPNASGSSRRHLARCRVRQHLGPECRRYMCARAEGPSYDPRTVLLVRISLSDAPPPSVCGSTVWMAINIRTTSATSRFRRE